MFPHKFWCLVSFEMTGKNIPFGHPAFHPDFKYFAHFVNKWETLPQIKNELEGDPKTLYFHHY